MSKDNRVVGILAHVDAGKTTLAENILYHAGKIRQIGRVDHGNSFFDDNKLERARGITIFSKQAQIYLRDESITLLDTPGHLDFSAETERTLQVLDVAILVINGADGITAHVETLWKLLKRYEIPVFLFINKMDQDGTNKEELMKQLKKSLHSNCVDFTFMHKNNIEYLEDLATCSEILMEEYLNQGQFSLDSIKNGIFDRSIFPCYFGSALKNHGVEAFLNDFTLLRREKEKIEEFGGRVYKITRDKQGNRLTHLKITGGSLKVKQLLENEKINQIRIYSGNTYELIEEAESGQICCVTGMVNSYAGQIFGQEEKAPNPLLVPVLSYKITPKDSTDMQGFYKILKELEEELPELEINWSQSELEILVKVMGQVQIEVLESIIKERYDMEVIFDQGSIIYKETVKEAVLGIGHYEPLRHYAEVHLLIEPLPAGSGVVVRANCSEEILAKNWQKLVLTHLVEKQHVGVLGGFALTDVLITLNAGKSHNKHTEGGDFREATYRAVRNGLMKAVCVLLEPIYEFKIEIPTEYIGRVMTDINQMQGNFESPITKDTYSILEGKVPVSTLAQYQQELIAFSKGRGKINLNLWGYDLCHNQEEVLKNINYQPLEDLNHSCGSVFCEKGAGFFVPWDQVEAYAHVNNPWLSEKKKEKKQNENLREHHNNSIDYEKEFISQEEIEEIFLRTYGTKAKDKNPWNRPIPKKTFESSKEVVYQPKKIKNREEYLLVDGYNIIFAWEELKEIAKDNLEGARNRLQDILSNYQGFVKNTIIVVYDAYKVAGNIGSTSMYHNIHIVYTKEAETADQYIEKLTHKMSKDYDVTVATSDALEQMIIWGMGAKRLSAPGLMEEIKLSQKQQENYYKEENISEKNFPFRELIE